jgi:hypothetical protein
MNKRQKQKGYRLLGLITVPGQSGGYIIWAPLSKAYWEHMLVVEGGRLFPTLYAKPIAPARNRWRRVARLLMEENANE